MTESSFCDFAFVVDVLHSGQMQGGIEKHRGVSRGKDEAIAIGPVGLGGIVVQEILPKGENHRSQTHRRAGVAGIGLLDSVDRKGSDGIDTKLIEILLAHGISGAGVSLPAKWTQAFDAPPCEKASELYCKRE